jgi:uncharacterized protein YcbK (DUF882 family)
MEQLSANFTLEEFTRSDTAREKGIANVPDGKAVENLRALCTDVLQPLRDKARRPISITSGYRSEDLNGAVGGAGSSQHLAGEAADIKATGLTARELFNLAATLDGVDQLILYPTFVHISHKATGDNRRQLLAAKGVKL